jgi:hypothetical protein
MCLHELGDGCPVLTVTLWSCWLYIRHAFSQRQKKVESPPLRGELKANWTGAFNDLGSASYSQCTYNSINCHVKWSWVTAHTNTKSAHVHDHEGAYYCFSWRLQQT